MSDGAVVGKESRQRAAGWKDGVVQVLSQPPGVCCNARRSGRLLC